MILACVIYLIDFKNKTKSVYFFQVFGRNPLSIYLLSELLVIILFIIPVGDQSLFRWINATIFAQLPDYFASLAFCGLLYVALLGVGYWLDKENLYQSIIFWCLALCVWPSGAIVQNCRFIRHLTLHS